MSNINHWDSYGVFCMAMSLKNINDRELDIVWDNAIDYYELFLSSRFNDNDKSELDCINEFLKFHNLYI